MDPVSITRRIDRYNPRVSAQRQLGIASKDNTKINLCSSNDDDTDDVDKRERDKWQNARWPK